jgi:hypothetical protein
MGVLNNFSFYAVAEISTTDKNELERSRTIQDNASND